MDENSSFFMNKFRKSKKNQKKENRKDIFKSILFLSLIILVFIELFIIIKQNIFIKYILQEEKKYKNETTNLENVEEIENLKKYLENLKNIEKKNNSDLLNITSYAQFLEDIVLFLFLYDVKKGFYIDVGANDPIKDSVTNFFYLRGWNGINIEPLDDKYLLLKNNRSRDINLNIAVGKEKGNATLYIREGLTTIMKKYSRPGRPEKIVKVETMADICKKYVPPGTIIEFCKIDVEGAERDVLLGYDFINYRPKIFCIEATLPLKTTPTYQLFEDVLINNNYSFIYQYNINRFYVDNKSIFANMLSQRVSLIDLFTKTYNELKEQIKKNK